MVMVLIGLEFSFGLFVVVSASGLKIRLGRYIVCSMFLLLMNVIINNARIIASFIKILLYFVVLVSSFNPFLFPPIPRLTRTRCIGTKYHIRSSMLCR